MAAGDGNRVGGWANAFEQVESLQSIVGQNSAMFYTTIYHSGIYIFVPTDAYGSG